MDPITFPQLALATGYVFLFGGGALALAFLFALALGRAAKYGDAAEMQAVDAFTEEAIPDPRCAQDRWELFGTPEPQSEIAVRKSKILVVPLLVEVDATTRFPGIPEEAFEAHLRMECARGARHFLDGNTLGTEPRVSVDLPPATNPPRPPSPAPSRSEAMA